MFKPDNDGGINKLYDRIASAVLVNGNTGDWFNTTVGVQQGRVLLSTIFNIIIHIEKTQMHWKNMKEQSASIENNANSCFADDVEIRYGEETKQTHLISGHNFKNIIHGNKRIYIYIGECVCVCLSVIVCILPTVYTSSPVVRSGPNFAHTCRFISKW